MMLVLACKYFFVWYTLKINLCIYGIKNISVYSSEMNKQFLFLNRNTLGVNSGALKSNLAKTNGFA